MAVEDENAERQLNIHVDPEHLGGVYSNFANISFSDYEFTLTSPGSTTRWTRATSPGWSSRG